MCEDLAMDGEGEGVLHENECAAWNGRFQQSFDLMAF